MKRVIEFRSYVISKGERPLFHKLVAERSFPLMKKWGIDVVDFGYSLHDEQSYYLIRSFKSESDRKETQDAFYGSDEWKLGPREEIVALIESDANIVIELPVEAIDMLRS